MGLEQAKFAIVGAGFGGLGMAKALKTAGEDDFVILEKGSDIGGVWRDNTYPGATCDVPSHLYSFSFAPYQRRDKRYPAQNEILAYLHEVADKYNLWPHLHLGTEVSEAQFCQSQNTWGLKTTAEHRISATFVIFAVGQLHQPHYPDIPGIESFQGKLFHSARWDHDVVLEGKTISLIGTGSSAAQILPALVRASSSVAVYQRTPHWILPKPGADFGYMSKCMLRIPGAHKLNRAALRYGADTLLSPIMRSNVWRHIVEHYARYNLRHKVAEKELVRKLMPTYPMGCKRIILDNGFYRSLNQKQVRLVTEPIKLITDIGIETESEMSPTDIIICATGFRASDFLVPITVRGRDGRCLNEDWSRGAEAFMGLAIHGYPNLFMIAGPNTFNSAGSNPEMKEIQIDYIIRCIRWKEAMKADTIEVTLQATTEYQVWLRTKIEHTVWSEDIDSWYRHKSGKVTNPWPDSARAFARMLRRGPEGLFKTFHRAS
jgi:cation diffusion facilitator CzcD-associated flavoprotein CzcO